MKTSFFKPVEVVSFQGTPQLLLNQGDTSEKAGESLRKERWEGSRWETSRAGGTAWGQCGPEEDLERRGGGLAGRSQTC